MPLLACPICGRPYETEISTAVPFCSDRCRQIDLGRWIDEEYGLPVERAEEPSHESQLEE
jgi:endogenous inhibitor of DNA gyrase (YacG/DUF329 family)